MSENRANNHLQCKLKKPSPYRDSASNYFKIKSEFTEPYAFRIKARNTG